MRAIVTCGSHSIIERPYRAPFGHRYVFTLEGTDGKTEEHDLEVSGPDVSPGQPIAISPPLKAGPWYAANGPSNQSIHRRALIPVGGEAHISQRFATDCSAATARNGTATPVPTRIGMDTGPKFWLLRMQWFRQ